MDQKKSENDERKTENVEINVKRDRMEEISTQLNDLKAQLLSVRCGISSESRKRQKLEETLKELVEGKEIVELEEKKSKVPPKMFTKSSGPWNKYDDEWVANFEGLAALKDANEYIADRPRSFIAEWVNQQFQRHSSLHLDEYQIELFEELGVDWTFKTFRSSSISSRTKRNEEKNQNGLSSLQNQSRGRTRGSNPQTKRSPAPEVPTSPDQIHYEQVADVLAKSKALSAWCWVWFKWALLNDDVSRVFLEIEPLSSKEDLKIYLSQLPISKFPPWARNQSESRERFVEEVWFWYRQVFIELKDNKLMRAELANGQSGDGAIQFTASGHSHSDFWGLLLPLPEEQFVFLQSIEQQYPSFEKLVVLYQTKKEVGMVCGPIALLENNPQSKNTTIVDHLPAHKNRRFHGKDIVKMEQEETTKKGKVISLAFPTWIET